MKKGSLITIIVVVLVIIFGIVFGIFKVVDSIKKDQAKTEKQIEEINTYYESLNENAFAFNETKEKFDTLMNKMYYETVFQSQKEITKILNEYDTIITKIKEDGQQLENRCSIYYKNSDTMQKCNSYKISYESAMQVFISDVKRYNTLVKNYNKWTEENPTYEKISAFVSKNVE